MGHTGHPPGLQCGRECPDKSHYAYQQYAEPKCSWLAIEQHQRNQRHECARSDSVADSENHGSTTLLSSIAGSHIFAITRCRRRIMPYKAVELLLGKGRPDRCGSRNSGALRCKTFIARPR